MVMFKNKLIFLVSLLLVVAGGVLLITVSNNSDNKETNRVIEDAAFTSIEVLTNNATVEIVPTKDSEATVEYSGASKKAKFTFKVNVKGETLSVELSEKRRFFFLFGFQSKDLQLTIFLPEKHYESIQVQSDNGRISAESIKAEMVMLETDNGQIQLRNIETENVLVETDNGRIILEHVEGIIKGSSDNGRISMTTKNLDQPIDLETDNGSIEIITDTEPTNATIETKIDNGKVTIFGVDNTRAIYGKGEYLINLRTDNGRITITK
ncbi:DUF4097 family beta strand repeat-containing protein [Paenisporosarcina sp. TG20]|uniref:DUF4097 family beta strand repeat-containing protein n=1 Tax=Paenisporosarcina sp. TG20 TaxID=1211706 RepID=UPI000314B538|nr:DUF4097 family beta strand repeat-containing protein [Paenisporosarcina sp. TG20]